MMSLKTFSMTFPNFWPMLLLHLFLSGSLHLSFVSYTTRVKGAFRTMSTLEEHIRQGTWDEQDLAVIADVLQRFQLTSFTPEGKLNAVCLMFDESCRENVKLKDELRNMIAQLEKQDQTKDALKNLIQALKTQVELTREEGELKLRDETQKRIDCSQQFQSTMTELSALIETNTGHNKKLKEENAMMAGKVMTLLKQFEERERRSENARTEFDLQAKLYEAQLAKAKIEKAELNAGFTRERLEMHKALLESKRENETLLEQSCCFKDQLNLYQKQYSSLEKDMGDSSQNFGLFRKEMEKLGMKLRKVERDTHDWKEKFESSNEQVRKMNAASLEKERDLQGVKKKLEAMEKLNRALQKERSELLLQVAQPKEPKEAT